VVRVSERPPNSPANVDGTAPATFREWQRDLRSYERLAAFDWSEVSLTEIAEPERVTGATVTAEYFSILKHAPLHGRPLVAADMAAGRERVVVLSEPLWQRRFGGNPAVLGQQVLINGAAHEIVGVMPRSYVFPPAAELWLPLVFSQSQASDRTSNQLRVIGLLAKDATVEQAHAEVVAHQHTIAQRFPAAREQWSAIAEPVQSFYGDDPRPYMMTSMVSVLLVLLIGCANVANLLLARATGRERELAVRTALGASRGRIIRLLLTESSVLALAGGIGGIVIALWGVLLFRNLIPAELVRFNPGWTAIGVDGATLGFALLSALGSCLVFGILPALQAARDSTYDNMRDAGRGLIGARSRNRTRNTLVVAEIALALTLVVSTGIMLRSFKSLLDVHPGFRRDHVLTMQIALPSATYDTPERRNDFYLRLEEKLRALPRVSDLGFVNVLPMSWNETATRLADQARAQAPESELPIVRRRIVSDAFFRTLESPRTQGRNFAAQDHLNGPAVVIVSDRLARLLWPAQKPIGKRVRLLGDTIWSEVVGVAADVRHNPNVGDAIQPTVYLPLRQRPAAALAIVLRTSAEPTRLATAVQRQITSLDAGLAAGEVHTLERVIHNALSPQRASARLLGVFGAIALILACVGIYGVMSYAVAQRASELGVRVTLGARQADILRLILQQGALLTGLGAFLGLGGAWVFARSLQALMHDAAPPSLPAFLAGTLLLMTTAMLACYLPARRAAATDPTLLLRRE
jgi:putative ABC transport system permease protein